MPLQAFGSKSGMPHSRHGKIGNRFCDPREVADVNFQNQFGRLLFLYWLVTDEEGALLHTHKHTRARTHRDCTPSPMRLKQIRTSEQL